jgi:hypothetical protein
VDPGFTIDSLKPLKLWVPSSLLPPGLVIQGKIRVKKRAKNASRIGDKKRRKVISRESSTECLERPESSSMGSVRGYPQASSHVQVVNSLSLNMMEGGEKPKAKLWLGGELIDLTEEDGAGVIPQFDGEFIDLTEEGEDKPETSVGRRSTTPWVDGDCIDLTIEDGGAAQD